MRFTSAAQDTKFPAARPVPEQVFSIRLLRCCVVLIRYLLGSVIVFLYTIQEYSIIVVRYPGEFLTTVYVYSVCLYVVWLGGYSCGCVVYMCLFAADLDT